MDSRRTQTRKITAKEAKACASEEVQYIGTVQPHGFVLVADATTYEVVQHSENVIQCLNGVLQKPLAVDAKIIGTNLSDWLTLPQDFFSHINSFKHQLIPYIDGKLISPNSWECLGHCLDKYIVLELIPRRSSFDSYSLLANLEKVVGQIRSARSLDKLYDEITQAFQEHTQFDRVMLYKFHDDWSGEVKSESVSSNTEVKYLGLRFPADDIPQKARELYLNSNLRVLADVDAEPVGLVPKLLPSGERLDQSLSVLRGMSLMHIQYLKNMHVKATMSLGLVIDNKLWGLIAFHHLTPKVPPGHLIAEMIASCHLLGDIILAHLSSTRELEYMSAVYNGKRAIESVFHNIQRQNNFETGFQSLLVRLREDTGYEYIGIAAFSKCIVVTPENEVLKLDEWIKVFDKLYEHQDDRFYQTNKLRYDKYLSSLKDDLDIEGLCIVKSKQLSGCFAFFCASEEAKIVKWGGEPHTVNIRVVKGERYLEPRSSFALWKQTVGGSSRIWSKQDESLAIFLCDALEETCRYFEGEQLKKALYDASTTDALTGLPNRRQLTSYINKLTDVQQTLTIAVFFLDVDNFKSINDLMGHDVGDRALKVAANRLEDCLDDGVMVSRIGGDEFVIIASYNTCDLDTVKPRALEMGEQILQVLGKPVNLEQYSVRIAVSVGLFICNPKVSSLTHILKCADIAMYHAKIEGKNRLHLFEEKDLEAASNKAIREVRLQRAVRKELVGVYLQPIVSSDRVTVGFEALARWYDEYLGNIPPEIFIQLAEQSDIIQELGRSIIDMALKGFNALKDSGQFSHLSFISINISPLQLSSDAFEADFLDLLTQNSVRTDEVKLEVTETAIIQDFADSNQKLMRLREKGVIISLDDFGTGFSSLSYLLKLPVDEVKIDKSFVQAMTQDKQSYLMVESIIELCKKLKLKIVAEGIEQQEIFNHLKHLGCDLYQGFYFAKPSSINGLING